MKRINDDFNLWKNLSRSLENKVKNIEKQMDTLPTKKDLEAHAKSMGMTLWTVKKVCTVVRMHMVQYKFSESTLHQPKLVQRYIHPEEDRSNQSVQNIRVDVWNEQPMELRFRHIVQGVEMGMMLGTDPIPEDVQIPEAVQTPKAVQLLEVVQMPEVQQTPEAKEVAELKQQIIIHCHHQGQDHNPIIETHRVVEGPAMIYGSKIPNELWTRHQINSKENQKKPTDNFESWGISMQPYIADQPKQFPNDGRVID